MSLSPILDQGPSIQVVGTPRDFLTAFQDRFGAIEWDLAANGENTVTGNYFGPGSLHGEDSLLENWCNLRGNLWLNPPFQDIEPWARKAWDAGRVGAHVNLLVPLSSSNWARDWCWSKAVVYPLNPRLAFVGHSSGHKRDMMLVRYGVERKPRAELWRWK